MMLLDFLNNQGGNDFDEVSVVIKDIIQQDIG